MPSCSFATLFQMDLIASLSPDSGYSSTDASPPPTPHLDLQRLFLELDHFVPPRELTWSGGDRALVLPPPPLVLRGEEAGFGINLGAHRATLDCHVNGPSGTRYAVKMAFVPELQHYHCLFRPVEIGLHVGVVMDESAQHLPGSPFFVNVGRNYSATPRSVVQLDVEMESEGRFLVRKPWGITSNSRTEEVITIPLFIAHLSSPAQHGAHVILNLTNAVSLFILVSSFWLRIVFSTRFLFTRRRATSSRPSVAVDLDLDSSTAPLESPTMSSETACS